METYQISARPGDENPSYPRVVGVNYIRSIVVDFTNRSVNYNVSSEIDRDAAGYSVNCKLGWSSGGHDELFSGVTYDYYLSFNSILVSTPFFPADEDYVGFEAEDADYSDWARIHIYRPGDEYLPRVFSSQISRIGSYESPKRWVLFPRMRFRAGHLVPRGHTFEIQYKTKYDGAWVTLIDSGPETFYTESGYVSNAIAVFDDDLYQSGVLQWRAVTIEHAPIGIPSSFISFMSPEKRLFLTGAVIPPIGPE